MKKLKAMLVCILFSFLLLTGCDLLNGKGDIPTINIDDLGEPMENGLVSLYLVGDLEMDEEKKVISFSVLNPFTSYNLNEINLKKDFVNKYFTTKDGTKTDGYVELKEGLNEFKLTIEDKDKVSTTYSLNITRLKEGEKCQSGLKEAQFVIFGEFIVVNEPFSCGLAFLFTDGKYLEFEIPGESIEGFDNTKIGPQELVLDFGPFKIRKTVDVKEYVKKPMGVKYDESVLNYNLGDKFTPFNIHIEYYDNTEEDILVTEDSIRGFDTTKEGYFYFDYINNKDGYEIRFNYNVDFGPVTKIEATAKEDSFIVGENFYEDNFNIVETNKNGYTQNNGRGFINIPHTPDMYEVGSHTITIEYITGPDSRQQKFNFDFTYTITIGEVKYYELCDLKTDFYLNEELEPFNATFRTEGNMPIDVVITKENIVSFRTDRPGRVEVEFEYAGIHFRRNIYVYEPTFEFKDLPPYYDEANPIKSLTLLVKNEIGNVIKEVVYKESELHLTPREFYGVDGYVIFAGQRIDFSVH